MPVSAKREGKQPKKVGFDSQCQEQCIAHISYYLLVIVACTFFWQPFSKQQFIFIGSYRRANYFVPEKYYWRPQSDSTVGGPFATRDSSQASPVRRDSSLQFGVIRRESEAPENSQTLLPIKVLSRGDNGIFGIVKALKYSYFVFFLFQQMGFLGRFCKFCRFCGSPICLATQCNYPETQYVTACSLEPRSILVYVLKFGSSAR